MSEILIKINNIVWGPATIFLILSCGVYFTIKTGFFQITHFKDAFTKTIFSSGDKNKKSSFKAVSAALAGTIGTGNIAGVATSIALGGPGAVFWMVVSAFFGMMTKYAEVLLAVKFRRNYKNNFSGGPMYYMEHGLGCRFMGIIFAFLMAFSAFGIGNMVQSNSVSAALLDSFNINKKASGLFLVMLCFPVLMGGAKKILSATEIIVPVMALFYLVGTVIFLIINMKNIPAVIYNIFKSAFSEISVLGGTSGFVVSKAVKYGIARGVFTNEAGLGSSPVAHASANVDMPAQQGLWGIFEVFFDTVVMCTLTALVILTADGGNVAQTGLSGMELTIAAFETVFGSFGGVFISISIIFFAIATILGWGFYGEKAVSYLSNENKIILFTYKILYISAIYIGAVMALDDVWTLSDILNGLMALPNIISLFLLGKYVSEETNRYKKAGP